MVWHTLHFGVLTGLVAIVIAIPVDNGLVLKQHLIQGRPLASGECLPGASDVLFVIDGSTSIGERNFQFLRIFLAAVVNEMPDGTQFAAVQFSGTPRVEFNFKTFGDNKRATQSFFEKLRYKKGTTKAALALQFAINETLSVEVGDRPDVTDIVIVITDGRSADNPKEVANKLRAIGAKTIAIGVTNSVDDDQLLAIGGSPETTFKITDFTKLDVAFRKLLISQAACVPITTAPSLGDPTIDVQCDATSISMSSETKNPFEGQVYIKGHFTNSECNVKGGGTENRAAITVPFDKCGTTSRRSENPKGIFVENTVVFKFHPKVLTKVDRVFRIQCFYMESDKSVDTPLEVSMLTTSLATLQFEMPTCRYTLHSDTPTGPPVRFALVGRKIVHKWQCDNSNSDKLFKMRVHSCFVTDGNEDKVILLDEDGCAIDKHLLNNLDYSDTGMMAFVETHAFKYADRSQLHFQCQVELCVNLEEGCQNTPPNCTALSRRRR